MEFHKDFPLVLFDFAFKHTEDRSNPFVSLSFPMPSVDSKDCPFPKEVARIWRQLVLMISWSSSVKKFAVHAWCLRYLRLCLLIKVRLSIWDCVRDLKLIFIMTQASLIAAVSTAAVSRGWLRKFYRWEDTAGRCAGTLGVDSVTNDVWVTPDFLWCLISCSKLPKRLPERYAYLLLPFLVPLLEDFLAPLLSSIDEELISPPLLKTYFRLMSFDVVWEIEICCCRLINVAMLLKGDLNWLVWIDVFP